MGLKYSITENDRLWKVEKLLIKFIASVYTARFKCHGFVTKVGLVCFSDRVTVVVDKFKRCMEDVVDGVARLVKMEWPGWLISQSCQELLKCGCKSERGCSGRCKCLKAELPCTALCNCAGLCDRE